MGSSTVSNLIKLIFTITVSCSGAENALMHHDHYLFLCLLWYFPESSACIETLLMLDAPQTWFRIHSMTQRANIWEILAAFVQHLSRQIQQYCEQSCIPRQKTVSFGANPQLGVWLPAMLVNVKKEPGPRSWVGVYYVTGVFVKKVGESCCCRAVSCGAGRQLSLLPRSVHLKADIGPLWSHVAGGRRILWEQECHMSDPSVLLQP